MSKKQIIIITMMSSFILFVSLTGIWSPSRWDMFKGAWLETVPISFYGKVVDDNGKPIDNADVMIRFETINWSFVLGAEAPKSEILLNMKTDINGRFKLEHRKGSAVLIDDIRKSGYEFVPRMKGMNRDVGFYYAGGGVDKDGPYKADPNNPTVFEMKPTAVK